MKTTLFLLAMFTIVSCSQKSTKEKTEINTLPVNTEITVDNAKQVTSFDDSPESVVMYFYASRIRKDNEWEKVCPPADKRSERLNRGLTEYNNWTFTKYHFVKKEEENPNKLWLTVYFSIIYEGDTDDGEDQIQVEKIDGKWLITEVPT